jgi:hypothetical protein
MKLATKPLVNTLSRDSTPAEVAQFLLANGMPEKALHEYSGIDGFNLWQLAGPEFSGHAALEDLFVDVGSRARNLPRKLAAAVVRTLELSEWCRWQAFVLARAQEELVARLTKRTHVAYAPYFDSGLLLPEEHEAALFLYEFLMRYMLSTVKDLELDLSVLPPWTPASQRACGNYIVYTNLRRVPRVPGQAPTPISTDTHMLTVPRRLRSLNSSA